MKSKIRYTKPLPKSTGNDEVHEQIYRTTTQQKAPGGVNMDLQMDISLTQPFSCFLASAETAVTPMRPINTPPVYRVYL
jgi:hypothetical protein